MSERAEVVAFTGPGGVGWGVSAAGVAIVGAIGQLAQRHTATAAVTSDIEAPHATGERG